MHHEHGEDAFVLEKLPAKSSKGFGCVRNCDGWRTLAVTPDEVESYAAGTVAVQDIQWMGSYPAASKKWCDRQYGEYFGNEASQETFYTRAAIVVAIPAIAQRHALALQQGSQLTADKLRGKPSASKRKVDAAGEKAASKKAKVSAPAPSLFPAAAGKNRPIDRHRTIHITGGNGGRKCTKLGGAVDIALKPGEGLRELKKLVRESFGKVQCQKLSKLLLADGNEAKTTDLVDGVTVSCTYTHAAGNPGGFGRRRGFGGFGGGFW